ncbi:MAG: dihydroorotate dehydrogenase electron transfer subunit [Thiogranum sp.]|nr:dihydroorotate dehydrogenase electron transfer subunit [Thiogranum sp.]
MAVESVNKAQRNTIFVESAIVSSVEAFAGNQFIMRLDAPECALHAQPGQFVHIQCDPLLAMRRPLSIMRTDRSKGWIDILFKAVGRGTVLLGARKTGDVISLLGPIGRPFIPSASRPRALLLGGGVGMPPMIFLAEELSRLDSFSPLVLLGSEAPFPFPLEKSKMTLSGIPQTATSGMPMLEEWNIASRLASLQDYDGCYRGYVTDLARHHIRSLNNTQRDEVEIFACGPIGLLKAAAELAKELDLPCQISLEEFMACGVGGCAGCAVHIKTGEQSSMKRACVDGPVFDAYTVVF